MRIEAQKIAELRDRSAIVSALECLEGMVVGGLIRAGRPGGCTCPRGGPRATCRACDRAILERRLERADAPIQVGIQITLLLAQRLAVVLQLLDIAAQITQLALERIQALRERKEALIANHALDTAEPLIDVIELDLCRIRLIRGAGAAIERDHAKDQRRPGTNPQQHRSDLQFR